MTMIDKKPERHEIEELLPWYAAGMLSRHDVDRVERALAGDPELARRYDLVRQELAQTFTSTRRSAYRRRAPWRSCSPQLMPRRAGAPRRRRRRISRTPSLAMAFTLNNDALRPQRSRESVPDMVVARFSMKLRTKIEEEVNANGA